MNKQKYYKLFEMDRFGNLYPLFIDKKTIYPIGQWIQAENHPTKGYAKRPGIHVGDICSAPWLMSADGTYKSQRGKYWKRVWCEVECNTTIDYTDVVAQLPKKCFVDHIPENGFYKFRETGCNRVWVITDKVKIIRMIPEEERIKLLADIGYDEGKEFAPYRQTFEKRMHKA
jgi:hypothetical protein